MADRAQPAICFPHMGAYHIPIERLLKTVFPDYRVFTAPPITKKTITLGSSHSPETVCAPFKYTLGNYIEALDAGATILFQTGLGCRYGYYGVVQEQILRGLGYDFQFICFSRSKAKPGVIYKTIKRLGSPLSLGGFLHAMLLAVQSIRLMDQLAYYIRENAGFEAVPGYFEKLHAACLREISKTTSLLRLRALRKQVAQAVKRVQTERPDCPLRVGIIGELYTLMEPFSNFYIENELAKRHISVSRAMSVSFLLFGKHDKRSLRKSKGYLRYTVGANGVDSVAQCRKYAQLGYDGIIHMKSFGCTPELNAMPVLMNMARDYHIPILHISFDTHTSETGVLTRIEAFCDMITMKREKTDAADSVSGGEYGSEKLQTASGFMKTRKNNQHVQAIK